MGGYRGMELVLGSRGPPFRLEPVLGRGRAAVKHRVTTVAIEAPIARMPTTTMLGCASMATTAKATCSPSARAHQTRMFSRLRSLTQGLPAQSGQCQVPHCRHTLLEPVLPDAEASLDSTLAAEKVCKATTAQPEPAPRRFDLSLVCSPSQVEDLMVATHQHDRWVAWPEG